MIRVLIVDDEWMVRSMLRTIMESATDIAVAGEAADGDEAVHLARSLQPDVVLMDIRMPRADGLAATERLGQLPIAPKVVMLTTFDLDESCTPHCEPEQSVSSSRTPPPRRCSPQRSAAIGDAILSPKVTRRLLNRFTNSESGRKAEASQRLQVLTDKEREVLLAVARGMANTDIAAHLYLSEATVKTHVSRILKKLALTNRVQAAILAHHAGLLDS